MKISPNGVELIKRFEGLELEAYQDIAGVWTIAHGHTSPNLKQAAESIAATGAATMECSFYEMSQDGRIVTTREKAEALLRHDLASREAALNGWMITTGVTLNQNEFDALVSFIYNLGFEAFKGSTAARWLREGKPREQVAEALKWWKKATVNGKLQEVTGLVRRRAAEKALFLTPVEPLEASPLAYFDDAHPAIPAMPNVYHRESNACAAKECRPLASYLPSFVERCLP